MHFGLLENFYCKSNNLSKECGVYIAKLIGGLGILKVLDISNNLLGEAGITAVASAYAIDIKDFTKKQNDLYRTCLL